MKLLIILFMLFSVRSYSQNADAITGKWIKNNKEDLILEVFENNGAYYGKIDWSKDNSKPVGFIMLDKLKYNEQDNKWEGGEIRDPNSGRTYDASITMQPDGTIEVTARKLFFKGKRLFRRVK